MNNEKEVIHLFEGDGKDTIITNIVEGKDGYVEEKKRQAYSSLGCSYMIAFIGTISFFIWYILGKKWDIFTKISVSILALFFSIYISNIIAYLIKGCLKKNPFIISLLTFAGLIIFIWLGPYSYFTVFTKFIFTFLAFIISQEVRIYFFSINMRSMISRFHSVDK
jgi:hypothetical protein